MSRHKNTVQLSLKQADAALQNILASCNMPPNKIPFDKILLRQKVNLSFYKVCMWISLTILLFTLFIPLPFLAVHSRINSINMRDGIYITEDYRENDRIYLTVSAPLLPDLCYVIFPDGNTAAPLSYDSLSRTIAFSYTGEELSIHLETSGGISATVIITPN